MRNLYLLLLLLIGSAGYAQLELPGAPQSYDTGTQPDWTQTNTKVAVDTCGAYFNNYIGLVKATDIYFEELRTGDGTDFTPYAGRGQRFHANQPIEISGVQFYSFQNNPLEDSLMVVTVLYDWDEVLDSTGTELARDTVWVTHTEFTPLLVDLEVDSYFDEPIVVTEDYIVALYSPSNDSLKIISSDPGGDGDDEGVSFVYYDNPVAPSFTGWYQALETFGPGYDLDFLMNPLVRYHLHDDFVMDNDTICPNVVSAVCTDYPQVANFSDPHYNRFYDDPAGKVTWFWGDGLQNTGMTAPCHTYLESGTYTITLIDSIRRHDYFDFTCAFERTKTIVVLDSTKAGGSGTSTGLTANFEGDPINADSVSWNFGDGSAFSTELDPTHIYDAVGTYDVWITAFGPCNIDSLLITIDIDDVSIDPSYKSPYSIYPNPADQAVYIMDLELPTQVLILNVLGEVVYTGQTVNNGLKIETNHLAAGAYFIQMTDELEQNTIKLIVRH
ncbi:MAG: T9SS type A sorting domain-containing protein [Crocinitomix sp.]|nr:T9SS type A sorting domain-containing protein [Crocinitomix sp.]